jgi:hypothetical protein
MAAGLVVEVLHADQAAARQAFAERFEVFASPERRDAVRATFLKADPA